MPQVFDFATQNLGKRSSKMKEDWKECKLGEVCDFQNGYAFKSSEFKSDGEYKVVKIKELKDGLVKFFDDSACVDSQNCSDFDKFVIEKNDVIFALTGDPVSKPNPFSWVGRVSIYRNSEKAVLNQRTCKVKKSNNFDNVFLYYYFRQWENFYGLASKATGSASQANISTNTIADTIITLPPLATQQKIAAILSSLDDKIELNNKINDNLEQQAQAIFKSWFVDFEPFGGKMPEGWRVGKLSEIADYLNGLAMQKFRPLEGEEGLPVLKIKELRQGCCDESSELCSPSKVKPEYIIHDGDVIFSWSGSLLVDIWCGGTCGLNQHLFKVTSKTYEKWFYYLWTKHHLDRFIFLAADKATTMGHIKREELDKAEVIILDDKIYSKLTMTLSPIIDTIINNRVENRRLSEIRDNLLPELMSGNINVEDITI